MCFLCCFQKEYEHLGAARWKVWLDLGHDIVALQVAILTQHFSLSCAARFHPALGLGLGSLCTALDALGIQLFVQKRNMVA